MNNALYCSLLLTALFRWTIVDAYSVTSTKELYWEVRHILNAGKYFTSFKVLPSVNSINALHCYIVNYMNIRVLLQSAKLRAISSIN